MQITDATDGKRENDFLTKVDEGELSPVERWHVGVYRTANKISPY